jgi:two-component system CheB/CheR fusion protein
MASTEGLSTGKTPSGQNSKPYPIVAIGASAGGLEAVSELLTNISPETGMAFVYVQHLDPTHKSMLSEILQRTTKMKVVEAKHLMQIEPNRVFVIPPNKDMAIVDGVVTVLPRKPKPSIQMSVDKFFSSLADKQKEMSIGVVLSGNANDGTHGLKSIKLAGGITFAQDESAKFQSMPRSAIAEGVVDMVLPPKEIAKELERISKHPELSKITAQKETSEEEISEDEQHIISIISLIRKGTGVDFSHYKLSTIKRRIIRRMLIYKLESLRIISTI